ncbi:aminodeoxychorismate synthase component 1 [Alteromonas sp. D210916BOD_24]|uniref:aminodeoxychorismate synthase component I n=1 Tax=Alteromonas sp. D210916BOD_24 TaxID=3157618 RepID=UPI00399D3DEF
MLHTPLHVHTTRLKREELSVLVEPARLESEGLFNALFESIANKPWSLLLDTAGSNKSDGRYNIMVCDPVATIEASDGIVRFQDSLNGRNEELTIPPFEATLTYLHSQVANAKYMRTPDLPPQFPFVIGVAGIAGYDTGRFYESLPSHAQGDYATPDYAVGLYLHSLIEDTLTGEFYFSSCDGSRFPEWLQCNQISKKAKDSFRLTQPFTSNLTQTAYSECLDKIQAYLRAGDCYQVNMAQRFTARFEGDMWEAYCRLRSKNQAPFSAFFKTQYGSIASISPERFIRVTDGIVETKPIKGTRPRYSNPVDDEKSAQCLLASEKDRAENLMIVDLLRNDISKHCKAHSVEVPSLFALESYHAVHHLVSTVVGELNDNESPLSLLADAFPGGSITGAPKIRAMEVIDELEPHRRNIYCGSIFYMGFRQDMDSSICIRTLLAEGDTLHCWAGGGIVLDSKAEDEYQETLDKVSKIIPVLSSLNTRV